MTNPSLSTTDSNLPAIPIFELNSEEKLHIKEQIKEGISQLADSSVLNEFYSLGSNSLKISKDSQDLINQQITKILGDGSDNKFIDSLTLLKDTVQKIDSKKFTKPNIIDKGLSIIGIDRYKHRIKTALVKYANTEKLMKEIIDTLENSKQVIEKDVVGLLSLEEAIITQQKQVIADIYALEVLKTSFPETEDVPDIHQIKESAGINLLDLKVLKEANNQFLIIIKQTCHNARIQMQSVDRACGITVKLSLVGLIMRAAMENNKRISNACKASQEFLSSQLVFNAEMFKDQTAEISRIKNSPVASIDQLEEARGIINKAIEESMNQTNNVNATITKYLEKLDKIGTNSKFQNSPKQIGKVVGDR